MRALYLAGTAAAAVTILTPALSYADCREDLTAFNARVDNVGTQDGPSLTSDERNEITGMRSSAEAFASSGDEQTCQRIVRRANTMLSAALDPQVIQPDELEGMEVRGRDDENLGEVEEIRVDPRTGRLAYLMVEYGGFAGVGEELAAIPWALVSITPEEDFISVDVTEQQIESAPRWSEDIAAETTSRDWAMSVHSFYGVEPFWRSQSESGGSSEAAGGGQTGEGASATNTGESGGESNGQSSSASAGQSGGEESSGGGAAAGAGAAAQMSNEGAQKIADGIDKLVEEISELRAVLSQDQQQASSGQTGSGQSGAQSGAGQSSGASSGEQPAEDDASADQATGGSQESQSGSSQSGESQSGGAGSGSSAGDSNQSSGQSETNGGSTSEDDN